MAAAKSMAPNTSIRGGGANDCTNTASSSSRRCPSAPYRSTVVVPCSRTPRASSVTASSSRSEPSEPARRSGHTARWAPIGPGPAMTVASATGSARSIEAATGPNPGTVARETGSTKTSMMPPHVRPTANASSSLTPYVCCTGSPVSIACCASSYTAPSTHPPDTLPTTSPPADTAMAAPGGRGALRNVSTTVASPNVSPASYQRRIAARMSRMSAPLSRQDGGQFLERRQAVAGYEIVDVRQRGGHSGRQRREAGFTAVRVHPDDAMRKAAQTGHLFGEQPRIAAFPAVAGEHDDGAACHAALSPPVEERAQQLAESGAAGP